MDANLLDPRTYDPPALFDTAPPETAKLFFPPEIQGVLDSKFMGLRLWFILLLAIILPVPKFVIPILIIMVVPGLKDKLLDMIRNGITSTITKP